MTLVPTDASYFKVFPCSLASCSFILFSIVITSLGEEGAGLCASPAFFVGFCHFSLSSSLCRGCLQFVTVALPGLFYYFFYMYIKIIWEKNPFLAMPEMQVWCLLVTAGRHYAQPAVLLMKYRKFPKYSDTQNICCNNSKILTMWLYDRIMRALFAQAYLSENLGSLRHHATNTQHHIPCNHIILTLAWPVL